MIMRPTLYVVTLLICLSCSFNQGVDLNAVHDTINIRQAADSAPKNTPVTQESLRDVTQTLVRISLPNRNISFFAAHIASNGSVETFMSRAGQSVSFRNGRITAVRGFGFDLLGMEGEMRQKLVFLDDNHQRRILSLNCQVSGAEQDSLEIAEIRHKSTLQQETCTSNFGSNINRYWTSMAGDPLQTLQWIGPDLGYLEVQWLN